MHPQTFGTSPARASMAAGRARRLVAKAALPLSFASLLFVSPAAWAEQASASGPNANRASASVDFRIVIPETVRRTKANTSEKSCELMWIRQMPE